MEGGCCRPWRMTRNVSQGYEGCTCMWGLVGYNTRGETSPLAATTYVLCVSVQIMMNEEQWDRQRNKNVIFNMLSLTLRVRRET
jgi:hypothetical protein